MQEAVELVQISMGGEERGGEAEITLAVHVGEACVLLGPNRAGKSYLLELCAGMHRPRGGYVRILGLKWEELSEAALIEHRLHIGTVLQQPGLLSNMTVFNNVALPLRYHQAALDETHVTSLVMAQLQALGLDHLKDSFPSQLNPGEIRCAAIARAMVLEQELLLLDDPVAGLDAKMVERLSEHLMQSRKDRPLTILATLRAYSPLLEVADRVAFIRAGRLAMMGSWPELGAEGDREMKAYLG